MRKSVYAGQFLCCIPMFVNCAHEVSETLELIVVQEIAARMGAVTGKGLSDLIREEFGLRITFFMMLAILIVNFGNVVTEFAGIAGSLELFGLSKYATVPIC